MAVGDGVQETNRQNPRRDSRVRARPKFKVAHYLTSAIALPTCHGFVYAPPFVFAHHPLCVCAIFLCHAVESDLDPSLCPSL